MLLEVAKELTRKIQTLIAPRPKEDDEDPDLMAFVGAPVKPRPPLRSSSIAVQPEP